MANIEELELDLVTALKRLPPGFLKAIADNVLTHKDVLSREIPRAVQELSRHVKILLWEGMGGTLDVKELTGVFMRVLGTFGVSLPDEDATNGENG